LTPGVTEPFDLRAVAADSAYGDQDGFRGKLAEAGLPFVMALNTATGAPRDWEVIVQRS